MRNKMHETAKPKQTEAPGKPARDQGALHSLVQVESVIQIGLLIPAATMIGWLGGVALDHAFHQNWIYLVGLLLGATAGFVQMFRIVLKNTKE
jgi:F0F1-type ATP synthase assembly protein I